MLFIGIMILMRNIIEIIKQHRYNRIEIKKRTDFNDMVNSLEDIKFEINRMNHLVVDKKIETFNESLKFGDE